MATTLQTAIPQTRSTAIYRATGIIVSPSLIPTGAFSLSSFKFKDPQTGVVRSFTTQEIKAINQSFNQVKAETITRSIARPGQNVTVADVPTPSGVARISLKGSRQTKGVTSVVSSGSERLLSTPTNNRPDRVQVITRDISTIDEKGRSTGGVQAQIISMDDPRVNKSNKPRQGDFLRAARIEQQQRLAIKEEQHKRDLLAEINRNKKQHKQKKSSQASNTNSSMSKGGVVPIRYGDYEIKSNEYVKQPLTPLANENMINASSLIVKGEKDISYKQRLTIHKNTNKFIEHWAEKLEKRDTALKNKVTAQIRHNAPALELKSSDGWFKSAAKRAGIMLYTATVGIKQGTTQQQIVNLAEKTAFKLTLGVASIRGNLSDYQKLALADTRQNSIKASLDAVNPLKPQGAVNILTAVALHYIKTNINNNKLLIKTDKIVSNVIVKGRSNVRVMSSSGVLDENVPLPKPSFKLSYIERVQGVPARILNLKSKTTLQIKPSGSFVKTQRVGSTIYKTIGKVNSNRAKVFKFYKGKLVKTGKVRLKSNEKGKDLSSALQVRLFAGEKALPNKNLQLVVEKNIVPVDIKLAGKQSVRGSISSTQKVVALTKVKLPAEVVSFERNYIIRESEFSKQIIPFKPRFNIKSVKTQLGKSSNIKELPRDVISENRLKRTQVSTNLNKETGIRVISEITKHPKFETTYQLSTTFKGNLNKQNIDLNYEFQKANINLPVKQVFNRLLKSKHASARSQTSITSRYRVPKVKTDFRNINVPRLRTYQNNYINFISNTIPVLNQVSTLASKSVQSKKDLTVFKSKVFSSKATNDSIINVSRVNNEIISKDNTISIPRVRENIKSSLGTLPTSITSSIMISQPVTSPVISSYPVSPSSLFPSGNEISTLVPPPSLPLFGGGMSSRKTPAKVKKEKGKFTPSLFAAVLNLSGNESRKRTRTGLSLRPLEG